MGNEDWPGIRELAVRLLRLNPWESEDDDTFVDPVLYPHELRGPLEKELPLPPESELLGSMVYRTGEQENTTIVLDSFWSGRRVLDHYEETLPALGWTLMWSYKDAEIDDSRILMLQNTLVHLDRGLHLTIDAWDIGKPPTDVRMIVEPSHEPRLFSAA